MWFGKRIEQIVESWKYTEAALGYGGIASAILGGVSWLAFSTTWGKYVLFGGVTLGFAAFILILERHVFQPWRLKNFPTKQFTEGVPMNNDAVVEEFYLTQICDWLKYTAMNLSPIFNIGSPEWGNFFNKIQQYNDNPPTPSSPTVVCPILPGTPNNPWLIINDNWIQNIRPLLVAADPKNIASVRSAIADINSLNRQILGIYKQLTPLAFKINADNSYHPLGHFMTVYAQTIENLERTIIPVQARFNFNWDYQGPIDHLFYESIAESKRNFDRQLNSLWTPQHQVAADMDRLGQS